MQSFTYKRAVPPGIEICIDLEFIFGDAVLGTSPVNLVVAIKTDSTEEMSLAREAFASVGTKPQTYILEDDVTEGKTLKVVKIAYVQDLAFETIGQLSHEGLIMPDEREELLAAASRPQSPVIP